MIKYLRSKMFFGEIMEIKNIKINGKIVLAPLAGYTNAVYREINKKAGADLVYSEMISAKGLIYENDKTWDLTYVGAIEHPIAMQLFGSNPQEMAIAAKILDEKTDCDIIDINMGCPVKKVLKDFSGSYLLQDIVKVSEIVSNVVKAVKKPVTVKIRAGWDHNHINGPDIARACEKAGASAIAIHGRTKTDLYGGRVNLNYIKAVKDAVRIPVIGNGDIKSVEDAQKMLDFTGVDAVMIGRASLGNPWLIEELSAYFNNTSYTSPTNEEKVETMVKHLNALIGLKGEKIAILEMRSLAAWYVKGFPFARDFKQKLVFINSFAEFIEIVNKYLKYSI